MSPVIKFDIFSSNVFALKPRAPFLCGSEPALGLDMMLNHSSAEESRKGLLASSCSTQSARKYFSFKTQNKIKWHRHKLLGFFLISKFLLGISTEGPVQLKLKETSEIGALIFPTHCHRLSPSLEHFITQSSSLAVVWDPSFSPSFCGQPLMTPAFFLVPKVGNWWLTCLHTSLHVCTYDWMYICTYMCMYVRMYGARRVLV